MFGYVIASLDDLTGEEKDRYQQVYCGLCRALGEQHGQLARLGLSYDMTFLILLLSALYEPSETQGIQRCIVHPASTHPYLQNPCTQYAADLTVALTYHKCMDDWKDEHRLSRRCNANLLGRHYQNIKERLPRQCAAMEQDLDRIEQVERNGGVPDEAANAFGHLMGELFVWREDIWSKPLRQFGRALGRFIYWMDAAVDYEDDRKHNRYNPLALMDSKPEEMEDALMSLMGKATGVFEKLPLIQDAHLMRSVLYAGVWRRYRANQKRQNGEGRGHGTGSL